MLGITAIAWEIPQEIKDRFVFWANRHQPKPGLQLEIIENFEDCHVKDKEGWWFSKAKGANVGVRKLMHCDVIIQADIDIIFPPKLLKWIYRRLNHKANNWIFVQPRFVSIEDFLSVSWEELLKWPTRPSASGVFNAAKPKVWKEIGGWNENLYGYGHADGDLRGRVKKSKFNFESLHNWPLVHISHLDRIRAEQGIRGPVNREIAKRTGGQKWL